MDLSLLTSLNPQALAAKAGIYALIGSTLISIGFYGGYKYESNQWKAEKFSELAKSQKLEREDSKVGAATTQEFKADKGKIQDADQFVKGRLNVATPPPLVKVFVAKTNKSLESAVKPVSGTTPKSVETASVSSEKMLGESNVQPESVPNVDVVSVMLTVDFMRLYDVSVQPGNIDLRTRTYDVSQDTTFDEGFKQVIEPNNIDCAANTAQLIRLQQRIREKQKVFAQPD